MTRFPCPSLHGEIELTEERERHIAETHPDLLPADLERIAGTLPDPDEIRRSTRFAGAKRFARWYDDLRGGKHVVVVVVTEAAVRRHRIVTA